MRSQNKILSIVHLQVRSKEIKSDYRRPNLYLILNQLKEGYMGNSV